MSRDVPEVSLTGGDLVPQDHTPCCLSVVESREQQEEEEEKGEKERDGFHAVPLRRSEAFRAQSHSYDPFKRHSWGPDREHQDQLSRSKLQPLGCMGPQEAPLLQSQEDLDTFLELQHQGGQPSSVVWTDQSPGSPRLLPFLPPCLSNHHSVPLFFCQLLGFSVPRHHSDSI